MTPVLSIRSLAAWLCLGLILLGSGGAHVLHAIPGLGHHDHACCHSHGHGQASEHHGHGHSHCGHSHGIRHDHEHNLTSATNEPTHDLSGKRWTTVHDCVLCEIIAVVQHGTLLVDLPEVSTTLAADPIYGSAVARQAGHSVGLPCPRGPPLS
ncbi:hypothetical protein AB1K70_19115 [Bremerella sp. JC770]|uniref:hypothetical protein n=1 Tax=Bremerella sp. JC770 TaxID=3232137 RepID=UPI003459BBC4